MDRFLARFLRDENGATAIEYGLIAALVFVVSLAAMQAMGTAFNEMFNGAMAKLNAAINGS
ncbi:Flp family type IVb pilin [Brevundimonas sp. NPDC092305]|uniref:Flp family type IVb pilin n=1 Tax=Brevundimonas sp. NPDC092305 TaxID=3363957 RepID=UPI0037F938E9